eukprot:7814172-Pyramimonas_sp.AAC.1
MKVVFEGICQAVLGRQKVTGPAGATLVTLRRLGWQPRRWDCWETDTGLCLDLQAYGNRTVKTIVDAGTKDMLLRDLTISDEAVGSDAPFRPCLEPLQEVCQDFRAS